MNPFDSLLPYLSGRVTTSGQTPQGGRFARLDNDLYFHTAILGKSGPIHPSFDVQFLLFFNPDGTHAAPPFEIFATLLSPHLGYDFKVLTGVLGRQDAREAARRIGDEFGLGRPSLTRWSVKASRPLPPGGVRQWGEARFVVNPSLRYRPDGYDWPTLGSKIQNVADAVLGLLELARPESSAPSLRPR